MNIATQWWYEYGMNIGVIAPQIIIPTLINSL